MDEHEIKAKALETAALILGPRHKLDDCLIPLEPNLYNPGAAKCLIEYDKFLAHYLELARLIQKYIHEDA